MAAIFPPSVYRVYVAFGATPLAVSPTWTNVTAWWKDLSVARGRSSELDDFQAGSCTVVLDNRDRRFDPTHAAGPYFGQLLPRTQIKVEAVVGATTYPVFRGHVTSWRQSWAYDDGQQCVVAAVDALALLATRRLASSATELAVRGLGVSAYWPLDDDEDSGTARDVIGGANGQYRAERERVDALDVGGAGASAFSFAGSGFSASLTRWSLATSAETQTTLACIFQAEQVGGLVDVMRFEHPSGVCYLTVTSDGRVRGRFQWGFNVAEVDVGRNVVDGRPHHLALVRDGDDVELFIDGASVGTASTIGTGAVSIMTGYLALASGPVVGGVLDEAAVFHGRALTAIEVAELYSASLGWAGDSVSGRIDRILDSAGWPSALMDLGASSTGVATFTGGADALSLAQRTARSEAGRLFAAADGKVTYQPPSADYGASPVVVFSDAGSGVRYLGYELQLDDRFTFNSVTVSAPSGEATVVDGTSLATYGPLDLSVETALPSAAGCQDLASVLLGRYSQPSVRGSAWQVDSVDDTQLSSTLALELGDVVTVTRTPRVGAAHTSTQQVVAITHSASSTGAVALTFTGAPVDTTPPFRWGVSTWGGADGWSG